MFGRVRREGCNQLQHALNVISFITGGFIALDCINFSKVYLINGQLLEHAPRRHTSCRNLPFLFLIVIVETMQGKREG